MAVRASSPVTNSRTPPSLFEGVAGQLAVGTCARRSGCNFPRTYLADGRRICWHREAPEGWLLAVDAELTTQPVPPSLGNRIATTSPADFWRAWTRTEVVCKLLDVPVLVWLTLHGFHVEPPGVPLRTLVVGDGLVVSVGMRRASSGALLGSGQPLRQSTSVPEVRGRNQGQREPPQVPGHRTHG